jgi:hypothetical protein
MQPHTRAHARTHVGVCVSARACARDCGRVGHECVRVRVCLCPRVSESVRVLMRAGPCARVRVHARVCGSGPADVWRSCVFECLLVHIFARVCASAYVCVRARVRASWLRGRCGGPAGAGGISGSAACAWFQFGAIGRCRARSAAGRTFTNRTVQAGWAARCYHTSVIDAAGAIYVIGGEGSYNDTSKSYTYYRDVWVSTDGGARPDSVKGVVGG